MPYILQEDRLDKTIPILISDLENPHYVNRLFIGSLLGLAARNAGDFNYMISVAIAEYLRTNGLNYANCNEIVGMLECCKREFQRQVVDPYEVKKAKENGDGVYRFDNLRNETY